VRGGKRASAEHHLQAAFDSGKADLHAEDMEQIATIAAGIQGKIQSLSLTGHTDSQRLSAHAKTLFTDNQGLSQARARSVLNALLAELTAQGKTVPGDRSVSGFGPDRPVASNANPRAWP